MNSILNFYLDLECSERPSRGSRILQLMCGLPFKRSYRFRKNLADKTLNSLRLQVVTLIEHYTRIYLEIVVRNESLQSMSL